MRAELTGFPSIDKLWLKYYGEEVLHRPLPEGSMYDYLTSCNVDRLDSVALNYFGKKVTHRQMQEKIDACARALTAYGVRAGDAVSLCVLAMPEAVYLLYAINKIGAIANMLVMNATEAEIHEKLAVTESKVVITVDLALEKIVQASKETSIKHIIGVSLAESMPCVIGTLYKWKSKVKHFIFRISEGRSRKEDRLSGNKRRCTCSDCIYRRDNRQGKRCTVVKPRSEYDSISIQICR